MVIKKRGIKPKKNSFSRINTLFVVISFFTAVILVKLFDLQVLKNNYYAALASGQHEIFENLVPERGQIYVEDKFSKELYPFAINKKLNLVYAVPKEIEDAGKTAEILEPILEISKDQLFSRLGKKDDLYEPLKHKISDEVTEKIKNENLKGIYFQPESWRFYPDGKLAAHILGFVGFVDDKKRGLYGIEGYYNSLLSGDQGYLKSEKDAMGRFISVGEKFMEEAKDGSSVVLSVDRLIQFKVEKYLAEATKNYGAEKGSIIIANPKTGEIIALACYPTFNPNNYSEVENVDVFRNSAIYDLYEPGSAFKPIVIVSAMDAGLVGPNTVFEDSGSIEVGKYTIRNFDGKGSGKVTATNILENSINVGMVQVAQLLGKERTYRYVSQFGFTDLTGIDLDVEIPTAIKEPRKWADSDLATVSFGQGFSVTPMRLVTAFMSVANGGKLMQPHIVKKIIRPDGSEEIIEPKEVRQMISANTAATLSAMLISVVENGQAKIAGVPGYRVAGKGGTAQVPNKEKVGYDPNQKITSFIGFAPADDPKFVMLVKFDNPKGEAWGVTTAAPVFSKIAQELFQYYQIPPTEKVENK
jgi:cell division protein FtsI/penicillin-binding protein 2